MQPKATRTHCCSVSLNALTLLVDAILTALCYVTRCEDCVYLVAVLLCLSAGLGGIHCAQWWTWRDHSLPVRGQQWPGPAVIVRGLAITFSSSSHSIRVPSVPSVTLFTNTEEWLWQSLGCKYCFNLIQWIWYTEIKVLLKTGVSKIYLWRSAESCHVISLNAEVAAL